VRPASLRGSGIALLTLLTLACGGPGATTLSPPAPPPLDELRSIPITPPMDGVQWGILFVDLETGAVLYALNASRRFIPASNRKVPVTAAAMDLLGPDFRWQVSLHSGSRPDGSGALPGDLVLLAGGDPTLGPPFHPSAGAALDSLAAVVEGAGIRSIQGALVVDASNWDSTAVPGSWMVEDLEGVSGASGGVFSVGLGLLQFEVVGGEAAGDTAAVTWDPPGDGLFVENQVVTRAGGGPSLRLVHLPESGRVRLVGGVAPGERRVFRAAVREAVAESARGLVAALEARGIQVEGGARVAWDPADPALRSCAPPSDPRGAQGAVNGPAPRRGCPGLRALATRVSPPLHEVVDAILGPSQNWMTEQLLRTLGAELGAGGNWREGMRLERGWLQGTAGVDSLDVQQRDGSGMSAQNLVTPRAMVQVLERAARAPWAPLYRDALPEPGEEDTTLESRLPELRGRVHAKTGTLTNVTTLSGYLVTDSGRTLVFSILTNGSGLPSSTVRGAIDRLVLEAARRW